MIKPSITSPKSGDDKLKDLANLLLEIKKQQVYVGVPESKTVRKGEPITNAQLLYIHTNGSPINKIPARPVIEPAIEAKDTHERIVKELKAAAQSTLEKKQEEADKHLKRAGMIGQNAARAWFVDPRNMWDENSPATRVRKRKKGTGVDQAVRPLIDTGQLRKSIIYVVKGEEGTD
jgi:hypothetical protein